VSDECCQEALVPEVGDHRVVHTGTAEGNVLVLTSSTEDDVLPRTEVLREDKPVATKEQD
jgi:hypothetical protein